MGKLTYEGPVPKDDPMFTGGPQLFSRPGSRLTPKVPAVAQDASAQKSSGQAPEVPPSSPPGPRPAAPRRKG